MAVLDTRFRVRVLYVSSTVFVSGYPSSALAVGLGMKRKGKEKEIELG